MGHSAAGKITFAVGIALYANKSGQGAFEELSEGQLCWRIGVAFLSFFQNRVPVKFLLMGYCRSSA